MTDKRKPWMKFYTSDWRADPGLRMCSYAARGLWADMLSLMHEAEPYGHLVVSGVVPDVRDLAGLLGGTEKEIAGLIAQLEAKRVFSRTDDGTIYSRRMLRDEIKDKINKDNGGKGGNPSLRLVPKPSDNKGVNPSDNRQSAKVDNLSDNHADNEVDKAQRPDTRDQKETSLRSAKKTPDFPEIPAWMPLDAWNGFVAMRRSARKPLTERAAVLLIAKLDGFRLRGIDVEEALNQSTIANYQGVFEPKNGGNQPNSNGWAMAQRGLDRMAEEPDGLLFPEITHEIH